MLINRPTLGILGTYTYKRKHSPHHWSSAFHLDYIFDAYIYPIFPWQLNLTPISANKLLLNAHHKMLFNRIIKQNARALKFSTMGGKIPTMVHFPWSIIDSENLRASFCEKKKRRAKSRRTKPDFKSPIQHDEKGY